MGLANSVCSSCNSSDDDLDNVLVGCQFAKGVWRTLSDCEVPLNNVGTLTEMLNVAATSGRVEGFRKLLISLLLVAADSIATSSHHSPSNCV
ncbi:hypothetical protein L1887_37899 [Cichorium endivia]|nr:hypothetical protein L1887_37899 [Cichorium endivia]